MKKGKAKKAKKATTTKKPVKKTNSLKIAIGLGLVVLGLLALAIIVSQHKAGVQKQVQDESTLDPQLAACWQNPVAARDYSRGIVQDALSRLPAGFQGVSQEMNRPFKDFLGSYLGSGVWQEQLEQIQQAKEAAEAAPKLTLIIIPDFHIDPMTFASDPESAKHQPKIRAYILDNKIPIVFQEGIFHEYTSKNLFQELTEASITHGQAPMSYEDFKKIDFGSMANETWFADLYDRTGLQIVGADNMASNHLWQVLAELGANTPYLQNSKFEHWTHFNLAWRSQLVLAKVVTEMRSRNLQQGYLVIGALHVVPLYHLCQNWGIHLEVQSLGLENYNSTPKEVQEVIKILQ